MQKKSEKMKRPEKLNKIYIEARRPRERKRAITRTIKLTSKAIFEEIEEAIKENITSKPAKISESQFIKKLKKIKEEWSEIK